MSSGPSPRSEYKSNIAKFALDILRLRMQMGLTQTEVACAVGITSASYGRLESESLGGLAADTFLNICAFFGLDPMDYKPTCTKLVTYLPKGAR